MTLWITLFRHGFGDTVVDKNVLVVVLCVLGVERKERACAALVLAGGPLHA